MSTSTTPPFDEARARRLLGHRKKAQGAGEGKTNQETEAKATAATKMANLLLKAAAELWHTPAGEPFATFVENGIRRHYAVNGSDFQKLAQRLNYLEYGSAPAADAVKAAINIVAGEAEYAGAEHPVHSRIAHRDGEIWVDLGDDTWRAVRISPALLPVGWDVVPSNEVPVWFRRSPSALPLPEPENGGTLDTLRIVFPNISDDDWLLTVGWMVGCFQEYGGRAFLEFIGGQGSGKSTLGRYLTSVIDPNEAPLRSMPKNEQDLMISVMGRLCAGLDNLSVILPDMADAFCRISTGAGISNRKLYLDTEEVIIRAQTSLLWTAIEPQGSRRPDLQDRLITIRLDTIEEEARQTEKEIVAAEEVMRPQHLGALYRAVATALDRQETVHLHRLPRLADFAIWVEAAAPAFGWIEGQFLTALEASRAQAAATAVEASAIGQLLVDLVRRNPVWEGTSSDLLSTLKRMADDDVRRSRAFPKDATRLSGQLRRMVQPLASVGVRVEFIYANRSRVIRVERDDALYGTDASEPGPSYQHDSSVSIEEA